VATIDVEGEAGHVDPSGGPNRRAMEISSDGTQRPSSRASSNRGTVVFHNHVGTYVETEEETARLLDETGPALVCLDCSHLAYGGGDTLGTLQSMVTRRLRSYQRR